MGTRPSNGYWRCDELPRDAMTRDGSRRGMGRCSGMSLERLNHYEQIIERQQAEIEDLRRQLDELERPKPHRTPAIR